MNVTLPVEITPETAAKVMARHRVDLQRAAIRAKLNELRAEQGMPPFKHTRGMV